MAIIVPRARFRLLIWHLGYQDIHREKVWLLCNEEGVAQCCV